MTISINNVNKSSEATELDELFWRVLWQPLDLPRNVRSTFKVNGESIEMTAHSRGRLVGGLMAIWKDKDSVELRHLAVDPAYQKQGIGRQLLESFLSEVTSRGCTTIHTYARDASVAFFEKLGFKAASKKLLDHNAYIKYGIAVRLMKKILSP